MKSRTSIPFAGVLALAASALIFQPTASNAAGAFKGKTIRWLVGAGAGGGYDTYSRMLAPHFAKELGATVVVENFPGAGGMRAVNRLAVEGDNGQVLHLANAAGAIMAQLLAVKGVRYDLTKLKILGIIDFARWQFLVSPKSSYNSLADVMKSGKLISWGGSGRISGLSDGAAFTCHALKLKCKIVTGYKGSRGAALAMLQGEMDALYVSESSAYNYVKSKNAKALATMSRKRSILFPNVPTVFELVPNLTADQKWWIDYRATVESLGRLLMAPPKTKPHLAAELRAATHKILSDPKVVAEGKKRKRFIKYVPAAQAEKAIATILAAVTPDQKARIKKVVLGTY